MTCVKCGSDDIWTHYHERGCEKTGCSCARCTYGSHSRSHEAHLHYGCRVCSWDWVGPILDAVGSP